MGVSRTVVHVARKSSVSAFFRIPVDLSPPEIEGASTEKAAGILCVGGVGGRRWMWVDVGGCSSTRKHVATEIPAS